MATVAQMRHAASIARHIREQALTPILNECKSIEYFYSDAQPSEYASYPVSTLIDRINNMVLKSEQEMNTIVKDMIGELTHE